MKTHFTTPKLMMLALFAILLSSCTADENELQNDNVKKVELNTDVQGKDLDTAPNENEPIIIKPPRL